MTLSLKYGHITPILRNLHWLPVEYNIQFKILLLTYKALNGLAPVYLQTLLKLYTHETPLLYRIPTEPKQI